MLIQDGFRLFFSVFKFLTSYIYLGGSYKPSYIIINLRERYIVKERLARNTEPFKILARRGESLPN